jgi:hypothetical protein
MTRGIINRRVISGWLAVMIGLVLTGLSGCGKKAPPVPPRRAPLPQVSALKGHLEGDTVTLTWPSAPAAVGIRGYVVLRAQVSATSPSCPGCPMVFQKAGMVNADQGTGTLAFSEPVRAGFIYTYKVLPVGSAGDRGPASNSVIIDRSGH